MLMIKVLHIIAVIGWFAGLFYLPRIFVNLAMEVDEKAYSRLLIMAGKLYKFTTILMIPALLLGAYLSLGYGIGLGSTWLYLKSCSVVLTIIYHHYCARLLRRFECKRNEKSHVWYRFFNEIPLIFLFFAVVLVVFKPF